MLILTRKVGGEVKLTFDGREIVVVLMQVKGKQARLGFKCDSDVQIDRPDAKRKKLLLEDEVGCG